MHAAALRVCREGRMLEKAGKIALEREASNSDTYNMSKAEVLLFSKAGHQKLTGQLVIRDSVEVWWRNALF